MSHLLTRPAEAPPAARRPRAVRGWSRTAVRVLSALVTLVVLAVVVLAVVVPRLAGATPFTVLTGSMTPAYPPGALVVVRPTDDVVVGDVVTYQRDSGESTVITHRVVGLAYDGDGDRRYVTQGDANEEPDADLVRPVQIRGEVWYSLPWVGHLGLLLTPGQHQLLVYVAAAALFGYAALTALRARRERRRTPEGGTHP